MILLSSPFHGSTVLIVKVIYLDRVLVIGIQCGPCYRTTVLNRGQSDSRENTKVCNLLSGLIFHRVHIVYFDTLPKTLINTESGHDKSTETRHSSVRILNGQSRDSPHTHAVIPGNDFLFQCFLSLMHI